MPCILTTTVVLDMHHTASSCHTVHGSSLLNTTYKHFVLVEESGWWMFYVTGTYEQWTVVISLVKLVCPHSLYPIDHWFVKIRLHINTVTCTNIQEYVINVNSSINIKYFIIHPW